MTTFIWLPPGTQAQQPTYTISGATFDQTGTSRLAGVTLQLSGSAALTQQSDSNGNFAFTNLAAGGNYDITPSKIGYTFSPASYGLANLSGNFGITFNGTPSGGTASTIQFSSDSYTAGEGAEQAIITVTRTGDSTSASSVAYRTADNDTFTVGCADTVNNQGAAFGRCDFAPTLDTLTFAPGETSKTFAVPIINDAHVEGSESFQVVLNNAAGATLGAQSMATVTIVDNDTPGQQNPIFTTPFFVRQQYLDFLAREPEAGEPWSGVLNRCADVNTGPDVPSGCDRLTVSGSFFGSLEFKDKGIYVIVFYRTALARLPTYAEFAPDLRGVTGATQSETFTKRAAFATSFTQRAEFVSVYGGLSNAQYIAALLGRYNLTSITTPDPANPDGAVKVTLSSSELLGRLDGGTLTRAQVLRAIVQSDQVSQNFEAVNAFVAAQYYGYLRRTPDAGGFTGWVSYLAAHPGDFRAMVNGFMNSTEYRLRFGAPTP